MAIDKHTSDSAKKPTPKTFYIYTLTDPRDNVVFYVGITVNVRQRYEDHLHNSLQALNILKYDLIAEMKANNVKPVITVIDSMTTTNSLYAFQVEGAWTRLMQIRLGTLLNIRNIDDTRTEQEALDAIAHFKSLIDVGSRYSGKLTLSY